MLYQHLSKMSKYLSVCQVNQCLTMQKLTALIGSYYRQFTYVTEKVNVFLSVAQKNDDSFPTPMSVFNPSKHQMSTLSLFDVGTHLRCCPINPCPAESVVLYFSSLKLELLTQFPVSNDKKMFIFFEKRHLLN